MICQLAFIIVSLISLVSANTETLRLVFGGSSPNSLATPVIEPLSGNSTANDRLLSTLDLKFGSETTTSFVVKGNVGSSYEVRVCWPASFPSAHTLAFEDRLDGTGVVTVKSVPEYYSQYAMLMEQPKRGAYEVVINELVQNALPTDIVGPLQMAGIVVVVAFLFAGRFLDWVLKLV